MDDIIIDNQPVSVVVDKQGTIRLKVFNIGSYFSNLFLKALLMALVFSINFCLFVRAGSFDIFAHENFTVVVGGILIKFFLLSLFLMFLLSFSRTLQNVLLALAVGIFVMAMLNQFALFDRYAFLSDTIKIYFNEAIGTFVYGISDIVAAVLIALLVLAYLFYATQINLVYLAGILLILNAYILFGAYIHKVPTSGWTVDYDNHVQGGGKGKKIINIMLSNAASYTYLNKLAEKNSLDSQNFDMSVDSTVSNLQNIMLGFALQNDFRLYPNAYVSVDNPTENVSSALNWGKYGSQNFAPYFNSFQSWDFKRLASHSPQLLENDFYSLFRKADYKLSVYQSNSVDLCRQYGKIVVDRCLFKLNLPSDVDMLVNKPEEKQSILLSQWIDSLGLFENSGKIYHNFFGTLLNVDTIREDGYQKLYVIDSLNALDIAAKDIVADKGDGAYLLMVDLPADMFVYNEFCMLKPQNQWVSMNIPSWKKDTEDAKQDRLKAYVQQYSCLFGKLQSFMDVLEKNGVAQNSMIVLQSISAPNDGNNAAKNDPVIRFGSQDNVLFAIRDPLSNNLTPDMRPCSSGELFYSYLYHKPHCSRFSGLTYKNEDLKVLEKLEQGSFSSEVLKNAQIFYDHWYKYWQKATSSSEIVKNVLSSDATSKLTVLSKITEAKSVSSQSTIEKPIDEGKEASVKSIAQAVQEKKENSLEKQEEKISEIKKQ